MRTRPGSTIHSAWSGERVSTMKLTLAFEQTPTTCLRSGIDHDYSSACTGRESQHLTKIAVERDECTVLSNRDFVHFLIGCSLERLIANRHHIVSLRAEQLGDAAAQILVQLEPHAAVTGTKRTRVASAP